MRFTLPVGGPMKMSGVVKRPINFFLISLFFSLATAQCKVTQVHATSVSAVDWQPLLFVSSTISTFCKHGRFWTVLFMQLRPPSMLPRADRQQHCWPPLSFEWTQSSNVAGVPRAKKHRFVKTLKVKPGSYSTTAYVAIIVTKGQISDSVITLKSCTILAHSVTKCLVLVW